MISLVEILASEYSCVCIFEIHFVLLSMLIPSNLKMDGNMSCIQLCTCVLPQIFNVFVVVIQLYIPCWHRTPASSPWYFKTKCKVSLESKNNFKVLKFHSHIRLLKHVHACSDCYIYYCYLKMSIPTVYKPLVHQRLTTVHRTQCPRSHSSKSPHDPHICSTLPSV